MIFKVYSGIVLSVGRRLLNAEARIWSSATIRGTYNEQFNGEILFRSSSVFCIHRRFDNAPSSVSFSNLECGNPNIKKKYVHQTTTDHYKV